MFSIIFWFDLIWFVAEMTLNSGGGIDISAGISVAAPDLETGFLGDGETLRYGIGPIAIATFVLPVIISAAGGGKYCRANTDSGAG